MKECVQTLLRKWSKIDRRKSKVGKFLSMCDFFSELLNEIVKFLENKSFEKLQMIKTRSEARFSKKCSIFGRKFPQDDPNTGKTEIFQVFFNLRAVFVQFFCYFLA